jgi:hypothetical protein
MGAIKALNSQLLSQYLYWRSVTAFMWSVEVYLSEDNYCSDLLTLLLSTKFVSVEIIVLQ